jgi:organic radical activating enzyme
MKIIYPLDTTWTDYPDNYSQSIIVYTIGCIHGCIGCQNPDLQSVDYSTNTVCVDDSKQLATILEKESKKHKTNKVVFSGGDPLFDSNINTLREFLDKNTVFDICIYTGYDISYVKKNGIENFEFVICNKYNHKLKQQSCKTDKYISFASTNQKLYSKNYSLLSKNGIYYFDK